MKRTLASVANKLVLKYAADPEAYADLADQVAGDGEYGLPSDDVFRAGRSADPKNIVFQIDFMTKSLSSIKESLSAVKDNFTAAKGSEIMRLLNEADDRLLEVSNLISRKGM